MTSKDSVVRVFKQDSFGRVELIRREGTLLVRRVPCGGRIPGSAWVGTWLARRERRTLRRLEGLEGVPQFVEAPRGEYLRSYLPGEQLDRSDPPGDRFFEQLRVLVDAIHARGVTHNDLAKEANILVRPDGSPALVDFQASTRFRNAGGAVFRMLVREDRRHLTKQMARRRPDLVTPMDRAMLARPSLPAQIHRRLWKPIYSRVTRRWLGISDSEGEVLVGRDRETLR